jgi:hypothetical protein
MIDRNPQTGVSKPSTQEMDCMPGVVNIEIDRLNI